MFSLSLTFVPKRTGIVVSTLFAVIGVVMTCAGVVQFVLCLQILFALLCGGFIWAVLNDKITEKQGKGAGFLMLIKLKFNVTSSSGCVRDDWDKKW